MCGQGEHYLSHDCDCGGGHPQHGCCCGEGGRERRMDFQRRFRTREERIVWLEGYLAELQAEAKAVEERVAEMEAAG